MAVTQNELWTIIHGMTPGAIFLLAFSGGIAELYALRAEWETNLGMTNALREGQDMATQTSVNAVQKLPNGRAAAALLAGGIDCDSWG